MRILSFVYAILFGIVTISLVIRNGGNMVKSDRTIFFDDIMKTVRPFLKKHKCLPRGIQELNDPSFLWKITSTSISLNVRTKNGKMRSIPAIMKLIVRASVEQKHLAKKFPHVNKGQMVEDILVDMKKHGVYSPKKAPKNLHVHQRFVKLSKNGTELTSYSSKGLQDLVWLDNEIQPLLKDFGLSVTKLHDTRDKKVLGINKNKGRVISINLKAQNSRYDYFYTLLHEVAHFSGNGHDKQFKDMFGQLILWCRTNKNPVMSSYLLEKGLADTSYHPSLHDKSTFGNEISDTLQEKENKVVASKR